jgi:hypothetical protein
MGDNQTPIGSKRKYTFALDNNDKYSDNEEELDNIFQKDEEIKAVIEKIHNEFKNKVIELKKTKEYIDAVKDDDDDEKREEGILKQQAMVKELYLEYIKKRQDAIDKKKKEIFERIIYEKKKKNEDRKNEIRNAADYLLSFSNPSNTESMLASLSSSPKKKFKEGGRRTKKSKKSKAKKSKAKKSTRRNRF